MKLKSPTDTLCELTAELTKSRKRWQDIYENGCADPSWSDGCNLNLIRNHIIYYCRNIRAICAEHVFEVPPVCTQPIPQKVDDNYMAVNGKYYAVRMARFNRSSAVGLATKNTESVQLTLF